VTAPRPAYAITVDEHDGALWVSIDSPAERGTGLVVHWPDGPASATVHCDGPSGHRPRVVQFPEGFTTGAPAVALIAGARTRVAIRRGTDGVPQLA